MTIARQMR